TREMPTFQRVRQSLLVDDAAARAVEHPRALRQHLELFGGEEVARLVGQGGVNGDEIALGEEFVQARYGADAELGSGGRCQERVEADDLHVQPGGAAGDLAADA